MRICEAPKCSQPVFGTCKKTRKGYCRRHQLLREDYDRRTIIQKAMDKEQRLGTKVRKLGKPSWDEDAQKIAKGSAELQRWFLERRKEMTGRCKNCNAKSCKDSDKYFKHSIAHILPKVYFPSIATNINNFIELCFWGESSCHSQMDNKMLDLIEMNCWDEIVTKFVAMYSDIAPEERRRIPQVLLDYVETEK